MYAVFANSGTQFKVSEGDTISIDRLDAEVGSTFEFDQVLYLGGDGSTTIGAPYVKGAKVVVDVVSHELGAKRETYKYRRTRSYRLSRGFRPSETTVTVTKISAK